MRVFDDIRPLRDGARVLARLLPEVDRPRTTVVVGAAVVVALAQVSSGVVTGVLIGRASDGSGVSGGTVALVVLLPTLLLLAEAARLVGTTVGQTLKRRVDGSLRRRVLAVSLDPPGIAHLEDPDLLALQGAARNLSPFSFTPGDAAVELTSGLAIRLQPVLAAVVLAWFEPALAALAVVVWFVAHVMFVKATVRLVMGAALTMSSPEVVYLRDLVQGPAAAKEVRVFGLGGWLGGRFLGLTRERMALSLAQRTGDLRSYLRAGSVLGVGLVAGLVWVGVAATRSELDVTAIAVCVFALLGVFSVPNLFPDVPVMFGTFSVGAVEAAERVRRERPAATGPSDGTAPAPAVVEGIRFRDVTFRYPGSGVPVVEHLDLFVPAGQRLAVVGLNGAGKTTMVKLLCRLYDPDEGRVEVDGIDLAEVDTAAWRRRVGVLFQDFIRWQLSLDDNLGLRPDGRPVAREGARQAAAARAGLAPLVDTLPAGWATTLSPTARGGVDLSGGQWQRVALARGLHAVETGASVLVLDEPTANLDPRAELEFYESVLRSPLGSDRPVTTILISHRFATVRHADRIVVVEGGRIVEDGTHDQLVAAGGRYRELFESQARTYSEDSDG